MNNGLRLYKVEIGNNIIGTQQRSAGVRHGMGRALGGLGRTWGREGWEKQSLQLLFKLVLCMKFGKILNLIGFE